MSKPSLPRLTYFDARGRAEPVRLLLHLCGVAFEDRRIPLQAWGALKPQTPFLSLPTYELEDGRVLSQAIAILYYLAEQHGYMGQTLDERLRCWTTIEAVRDLMSDVGLLNWSHDFETAAPAYIRDKLPGRLACLEAHLRAGGRHDHWAGDGLTCADVYAWAGLNAVQPLAPDVLGHNPALCAFKAGFEGRPEVAAYLDSPARPKTYTVAIAAFGGTPETSGR